MPSSLRAPQSTGHLNAFEQKVAAEEIYQHMGAAGGWLMITAAKRPGTPGFEVRGSSQ